MSQKKICLCSIFLLQLIMACETWDINEIAADVLSHYSTDLAWIESPPCTGSTAADADDNSLI